MPNAKLERAKRIAADVQARIAAAKKEKEKENATPPVESGTIIDAQFDQNMQNYLKEFFALMNDPQVRESFRNSGEFSDDPTPPETKQLRFDVNADDFDPTNNFNPGAKVYGLSREKLAMYHTPNEVEAIEQFKNLQDAAFFAANVRAFRTGEGVGAAMRQTKAFKHLQARLNSDEILKKSLATGLTGYGAEWIPTGFSSQLTEQINLNLQIASQFTSINMPTNPYKFPLDGGDVEASYVPESISDASTKIPTVALSTGNFTFTAKKLAARHLFSEEINEDSVISMIPYVREKLGAALARAMENAILNGDDSTTHQDANVTSVRDARKAFKGLRYFALNNGGTSTLSFSGAAPTLTNLNSLRKLLGKYGVYPSNLIYAISPSSYYGFLAISEVRTVDKYGQGATILRGELGRIDNIPIIVSEFVRKDLHTTGKNTTGQTNNLTVVHLFDKRGFWIGNRSGVQINSFRDLETDQMVVVAKQRTAFQDVFGATNAANIQSVCGINVLG